MFLFLHSFCILIFISMSMCVYGVHVFIKSRSIYSGPLGLELHFYWLKFLSITFFVRSNGVNMEQSQDFCLPGRNCNKTSRESRDEMYISCTWIRYVSMICRSVYVINQLINVFRVSSIIVSRYGQLWLLPINWQSSSFGRFVEFVNVKRGILRYIHVHFISAWSEVVSWSKHGACRHVY